MSLAGKQGRTKRSHPLCRHGLRATAQREAGEDGARRTRRLHELKEFIYGPTTRCELSSLAQRNTITVPFVVKAITSSGLAGSDLVFKYVSR